MTDYEKIERTKKSLKRAGSNFLASIFIKYESKDLTLSGEDALLIFNTIGQPLEIIIIIASAFMLTVDELGFEKLLNEQKERLKNSRQCEIQS